MYVWQMNDGSWRISLLTSQGGKYAAILACGGCKVLYDKAYRTRAMAERAERVIAAHLARGIG